MKIDINYMEIDMNYMKIDINYMKIGLLLIINDSDFLLLFFEIFS